MRRFCLLQARHFAAAVIVSRAVDQPAISGAAFFCVMRKRRAIRRCCVGGKLRRAGEEPTGTRTVYASDVDGQGDGWMARVLFYMARHTNAVPTSTRGMALPKDWEAERPRIVKSDFLRGPHACVGVGG